MRTHPVLLLLLLATTAVRAENWPRWRGPGGQGVSSEKNLPSHWSPTEHVQFKAEIPGEGSSSPIVWEQRVFLTSSAERGTRRRLHCLDAQSGKLLWSHETPDNNPEITSSVTGYAASTPVTDGQRVIVWFGNAGVVACDMTGKPLWHHKLEEFETELGLASSPILVGDLVILVCDHDGDRYRTFDSYLLALDKRTGRQVWKTERPKLFRSWSTPIVVPAGQRQELIVSAQDELRGYDPASGKQLWSVTGQTGWVTPSPVFAHGLVFATSGKNGPTLAVRPGGRGDVTNSHVAWSHPRGAPYVCSPLVYGDQLYVHDEGGILTCYQATTGKQLYRERLAGKFFTSAAAGDGKVYLSNEAGTTYVLQGGPQFKVLAENALDEYTVASPCISGGRLYLRTDKHLYCVGTRKAD